MTKQVVIPFLPRFREPMLKGTKTWTSRTKRYGDVGDTFEAFGQTFELTSVSEMRLDVVAWLHSRDEGLDAPEEFMTVWASIHPRKGYDPNQKVWVHQFKKAEEGNKT